MPLVVFLILALAVPKGMTPVPPSQVHGRTFTSPDGWFSIDAPGDGWEWLEMTTVNAGADLRNPPAEGVTWTARSPNMDDWFVLVESQSKTDNVLDDGYIASLKRKFRDIYTRDGGTFSDMVVERLNVPERDSIHYTFKTADKSGAVTYHFGYAVGKEHRVMILTSSPDAAEPRRLKRAIVSFRWLKAP